MSAPGHAAADAGLRVAAVVVTYNRRDLLLESLAALRAQTRPPDVVVVVDNASTDGTAEAVRASGHDVAYVGLARNTGGAGGFVVGMADALARGCDLLWLMDDDTVPEPEALAAMLRARAAYAGPPPALVASRVEWTDGRPHPMNTPRRKPLVRRAEREAAAAVGCVPVRSASFVSVLVEAAGVRARGLPTADFFLWNDDFEFTSRLLRGRRGLLCPDSLVVHKTRTFGSTDVDPGPRFFYEVRNKVWTLTRSRCFGPGERLLYAGATLRRWGRTVARSGDRRTLLRALGRGLAAGASAPRPNREVLAGTGVDVTVDDGRRLR
jgi:rhamnopyranosyl-N-acetylglucosaminyl-diphospho-decaprenol beta-1,3/1,4-galactofuranosyltransferase